MSESEPTAEEIFHDVLPLVHDFWVLRNEAYQGSWCKHGLLGAVLNLFRKTDRLDVWVRTLYPALGEPTVDSFFDAAAYACAALAYVAKNYPDEFAAWLVSRCREQPMFQVSISSQERFLAAKGHTGIARPLKTALEAIAARTEASTGGSNG